MTLTEISTGLEKAVQDVYTKKAKLDEVKKLIAGAEEEYGKAMTAVKDLHTQYSSFMSNVLTNFGQIHK
jgi:hypothetical protein